MPRPAHRRCKVQGPTCNGVAHPGFDNCARCLHDVIRPRLREEKAAVRRRRAARLSMENRTLINEIDLKEPQMRTDVPAWIPEPVPEEEPIRLTSPREFSRAVAGYELDKEIAGLSDEQRVAHLGNLILEHELQRLEIEAEVPLTHAQIRELRRAQRSSQTNLEEEPEPMAIVAEQPKIDGRKHPARRTPLTAEASQEIVDAYLADMTTDEIRVAYRIGTSTLYKVLRAAGVQLRGTGYQKGASVPDIKASPPVSAPPVADPTPNGTVSDLPQWVVTYEVRKTETAIIAARDFNAAAAAVAAEEGIEVISVARKR